MPPRNEPDTFTFTVEGGGRFPFDMLRYDHCWPATSEDAIKIAAHPLEDGRDAIGNRTITLMTYGGRHAPRPTPERWKSFMWNVTGFRF